MRQELESSRVDPVLSGRLPAENRVFKIARQPRFIPLLAALVLFAFLALTVASALTKEPWEDESWFGTATFNLATKGSLSTDVLEGAGTWRAGMKKHFYWEPPLSFVVNAAAVRIFGFSLLAVRSVSIAFGILAIICAFFLTLTLTGRRFTALLAMALVASDYFFLVGTSDGRMDAMCMSLGLAGLTAYFVLRQKRLAAAVLVSQCLVVASGVTHPNGLIWFIGVALLIIGVDRQRLRVSYFALAALPYLVAAFGWGAFIAQDPQDFKKQLLGNIEESGSSNQSLEHPLKNPLRAIKGEINERYLAPYGLTPGVAPVNRLKGAVLIIYAGAFLIAVTVSRLRRSMAVRVLLSLIVSTFTLMTYVAGNKMYYYLIHITPLFAILTALLLASAMAHAGWRRTAAISIVVALVIVQAGGLVYRIRQNSYRNQYLPAVAAIREHSSPGDLVLAPSAFFWTLHGERTILDDFRWGYYSHAQPTLIVTGPFYRMLERPAQGDWASYLQRTLRLYQPLPLHGEYEMFSRRP